LALQAENFCSNLKNFAVYTEYVRFVHERLPSLYNSVGSVVDRRDFSESE
jgi:hypothetical protein